MTSLPDDPVQPIWRAPLGPHYHSPRTVRRGERLQGKGSHAVGYLALRSSADFWACGWL